MAQNPKPKAQISAPETVDSDGGAAGGIAAAIGGLYAAFACYTLGGFENFSDRRAEARAARKRVGGALAGAEARLRYGLLLKKRGKLQEAQRVLKDLLDGARLGPAHYRRAQAEWLDRARRELS